MAFTLKDNRAFCKYVCPITVFLKATSRFSLLKIGGDSDRFAEIIGLPVILTEQEKLGDTLSEVLEARPNLQAIRKLDFDCFGCEEFVDEIRGLGKRTLILAGVETHICVAQTALHAAPDHTVHVVSDATSSRTEENWRVALDRMHQAGVVITSTEMAIYELLQRAGTNEFRAVLPLVK